MQPRLHNAVKTADQEELAPNAGEPAPAVESVDPAPAEEEESVRSNRTTEQLVGWVSPGPSRHPQPRCQSLDRPRPLRRLAATRGGAGPPPPSPDDDRAEDATTGGRSRGLGHRLHDHPARYR
jgi:hypothetical protein